MEVRLFQNRRRLFRRNITYRKSMLPVLGYDVDTCEEKENRPPKVDVLPVLYPSKWRVLV